MTMLKPWWIVHWPWTRHPVGRGNVEAPCSVGGTRMLPSRALVGPCSFMVLSCHGKIVFSELPRHMRQPAILTRQFAGHAGRSRKSAGINAKKAYDLL